MRFFKRGTKNKSTLQAQSLAVFVGSEAEVSLMDIRSGPFVPRVGPRGGRVEPLASVHSQHYGDTLDHLAALFSMLTTRPSSEAWAEIHREAAGTLARFSHPFVRCLASIGPPQREGQDLRSIYGEIADRWINAVRWSPSMQIGGLTDRIFDYSHRCRVGEEKGLPVWVWHGPRVPEYGIAHGVGAESYEEYRRLKGR